MCIAGGRIEDFQRNGQKGFQTTKASQPIQRIANHEHLYYEGDSRDHIYIVQSGWVKLYRTMIDGQRQVVGFANGGSILGLESETQHPNGCEAITDVVVHAIPAERLRTLCQTDPDFVNQLVRQLGRQLGAAQEQLATVGAQSAEQKLATFLLSISRLCEETNDAEFDLPMRRGDMAEFLGLRLETVSRKMTEFQRRGWIRMTSLYHCRILRRHVLEELAEGGEIESGLVHAS